MSTLVGKRLHFDEEIPSKQHSPLHSFKRSIRYGEKVETLQDIQKKAAISWIQSAQQKYHVFTFEEIKEVLEKNDYDFDTVEQILKEKIQQQQQAQSQQQRTILRPSIPELSIENQKLVEYVSNYLVNQLKNVTSIEEGKHLISQIFAQLQIKLNQQNETQINSLRDDNNVLKQGFTKQLYNAKRIQEIYDQENKSQMGELSHLENEIKKLQQINRNLDLFLRRGFVQSLQDEEPNNQDDYHY